jgi:hypothetical protein
MCTDADRPSRQESSRPTTICVAAGERGFRGTLLGSWHFFGNSLRAAMTVPVALVVR